MNTPKWAVSALCFGLSVQYERCHTGKQWWGQCTLGAPLLSWFTLINSFGSSQLTFGVAFLEWLPCQWKTLGVLVLNTAQGSPGRWQELTWATHSRGWALGQAMRGSTKGEHFSAACSMECFGSRMCWKKESSIVSGACQDLSCVMWLKTQ